MTTMGDPPKASSRLISISPNEVSAVDMPANGEPHFVVKGMRPGYDPETSSEEKRGGQMTSPVTKLDESAVPRPVMKAIKTRLDRAIESVGELQSISKSLKVADDGEAQKAPAFLADMCKAVSAEIRSLLPDAEVPVYKRGQALSVMSLHAISKQAEDVEKANAVSYLMRDQYVSVTQSVSEYLSTYVDGVEMDDDGPMLIPVGLEETVDKSANELDGLVDEYPSDGGAQVEPTPPQAEPTQKAAPVMQVGIDFAGEFAKLNKSIMTVAEGVAKVVASSQKETDMDNDNDSAEVVIDDPQATDDGSADAPEETPVDAPEGEPTDEPTDDASDDASDDAGDDSDLPDDAPVAKTDDPILKAIAAMEGRMTKKFEKIEQSVEDVRGVAKAADEKVEKAMLRRADSKGGDNDNTTKVTEKGNAKDDPSSFKGVLGLS